MVQEGVWVYAVKTIRIFTKKSASKFAWERFETELHKLSLSVSSVSNVRETDIYSVGYILTKEKCIALNHLPHAQTDWWFCVTNMLQICQI